MGRTEEIIDMVREAFPDRALLFDGWHIPRKTGSYSTAEPLLVLDLSFQDFGDEDSTTAILVVDIYKKMQKPYQQHFSEVGLTRLKLLPKDKVYFQTRKILGLDHFDDSDDVRHHTFGN